MTKMQPKKNGKIKSLELAWIVVSDLEKAKKFFTDSVGLKVCECNDEYGWMELAGHEGGARLGVAQSGPMNPISAGENAVVTFTVDNIESSVTDLAKKGVRLIGSILEVPDEVKMQLFVDADGNKYQLVEKLKKE